MSVPLTITFLAALAMGADVPGSAPFRLAPAGSQGTPQDLSAPPPQKGSGPATSGASEDSAPVQSGDRSSANHSSKTLQPQSRMLLIRYVDGEFAHVTQPLPGGKKGYKLPAGKPLDMKKLADALRLYGTAAGQGDTVQITGIEFRSDDIIVRINGGGKKHFRWRDHVAIGMGNVEMAPPPQTKSYAEQQLPGATLVLDYPRGVPDMSPDDLKRDLSVMLDFSKQHSSTVNWVDTLAPQFKQAIKDERAIVGMDSEMVLAALGRPEHKVRQRDAEGHDTEDWIYGTPPSRTTFVTFEGDTVVRVKEYN